MAFDAAQVIHVGISSLFLLLGLAIAIVGRKVLHVVGLGAVLAVLGLQFLVINLASVYDWEAYLLRGAQHLLSAAAGIASAFVLPRFFGVRPRGPAAYAIAAGVLIQSLRALATDLNGLLPLLGMQDAPAEMLTFLRFVGGSITFTAIIVTATVSAAVAFQSPTDPRQWRVAAALSCALGIWGVVRLSSLSFQPMYRSRPPSSLC